MFTFYKWFSIAELFLACCYLFLNQNHYWYLYVLAGVSIANFAAMCLLWSFIEFTKIVDKLKTS